MHPYEVNSYPRSGSELIRFVALTLSLTAALHLSLPLFGLPFSFSWARLSLYFYLAGLAIPSVVALLLCRKGQRAAFCGSILSPRGSVAVYVAALFSQASIVCLAWLMALASGLSVEPDFSPARGFLLLAAGQVWVVLGEEPGWRGFALPRLLSLLSPRQATIALALIWGTWHVPMFFVAGSLQADTSPWLFAGSIFAWSALHTALYQASRPSIVPNVLFHGAANVTLNTGLVPIELQRYLFLSYVLVGVLVLAALRPGGWCKRAAV